MEKGRPTHRVYLLAAAVALGCGGADPRKLTLGKSCDSPGLARALVAEAAHAWVTEEEQSRVHRFDLNSCGVDLEWQLPAGPRAIVRLPGERVATANQAASSLSVALNDGGAESLPISGAPASLAAGDLDGDGQSELVASFGLDAADAGWGVYASSPLAPKRVESLAGASSVTVADLDGDGVLEVLVAQSTAHRVTVFAGSSPGVDVVTCDEPFALAARPGHGALVTCRTGGLQLLDGPLAAPSLTGLTRGGTLYQSLASDLDGDGLQDLAGVDPFAHRLLVWWGQKTGFTAPLELAVPEGPVALALADPDADGDSDLVVLSLMAKKLTVVVNPSRGNSR